MKDKNILIFLILLFHLVGAAGFLTPALSGLFIRLVPWHLLLMLILLFLAEPEKTSRLYIFLTGVFLAGLLIELAGVHTGLIFGTYCYGSTLGIKLAGVPPMIGINWVILIWSAGVTTGRRRRGSPLLNALPGAAILVLLDMLIEPVAMRFGYWSWENGSVPTSNYFSWFLVSFLMLYLFHKSGIKKDNPAAPFMMLAQFVFFIILNLAAF